MKVHYPWYNIYMMKRFKLKKFYLGITYFIILIYLEVLFRLLLGVNLFNINWMYITLFSFFMTLILSIINRLGSPTFNKTFFLMLLFLLGFVYSLEFCMFKMFGFYFEWSLLAASNQVASFAGDGYRLVLENVLGVILLMLPFIAMVIWHKKIYIDRVAISHIFAYAGLSVLVYFGFVASLNIGKDNVNSAYKLYNEVNNIALNINKFGVLNSFFIDTKRNIFPFEEKIEILDNIEENEEREESEIHYDYNNLEIDFASLIESEKNTTIKNMHEFFASQAGTLKNEYTNYFAGKNLILFMAESFNEIAVREDLTPTLYKLVHSGFVFENFYTPTISSTIGGEFQELTGLVAASGFLSPWKSGENYFPFGIGKVFKEMNYDTYAYHDHNYTFQSRNKYLQSLGFTNYKGCRSGLEKLINCKIWPESDVEMIEATTNDYINSEEPFFTYYVTVSGHGDYSFSQSAMARKNKEAVKNLNYSEKPKSYLAAQIELDHALELLIQKLEEAGKLDDTVIALVGDHYPYYLSLDEVNEIAEYKKDSVIEINHSNFILWNNKMDTIKVEKVGSQIDVLPTIYNLFGVPYDSRLIIGKDILSTEAGLAIFGNASWVSDKGKYFSSSNKFVANEGVEVTEEYIEYMNKTVNNKIVMSKNIMINDYYRKVISDK